MHYEVFNPSQILQPYIECFWFLESNALATSSNPDIVLPDGKMELIIHFGDCFSISRGKGFSRQARSLLSGQMTEKIFLQPTGVTGMIAARFKPAGAGKFFDFPLCQIADQVIDLESCVGMAFREVEDQVFNASSHQERVIHLENFLIGRLNGAKPDDPFIEQACRYMVQSAGEYSIANLANLVGLSERQIERKFQNKVGLSPKVLSRIFRFQKFMSMTVGERPNSLTEAALACGYYDQAHFIRDFKSFSGLSPTKFLAQDNILNDFFIEK